MPSEPSAYFIHAIDHVACFNHGNLGSGPLRILSEEETLLTTDIRRLLYRNMSMLKKEAAAVLADFRPMVRRCEERLEDLLNFVPPSWNLNLPELKRILLSALFQETWLNECEVAFRHFLQGSFR